MARAAHVQLRMLLFAILEFILPKYQNLCKTKICISTSQFSEAIIFL